MLMDFQIEGGQAVTAEIVADAAELSYRRNSDSHEIRTFELSGSIWAVMFASYAVFFGALILATGHGAAAIFALVVSIAYTIMYFGTAAILNNVSAPARAALPPASKDGGIVTNTGWMSDGAVKAQILTVPILLAVFACSFAIIRVSI
jgi:hypothetical protein